MTDVKHLNNLITLRPAATHAGTGELLPIGLLQILYFLYFVRNKCRIPNPDVILTSDNPYCELTGAAIKQIINGGNKIELHSTQLVRNNIFHASLDYAIHKNSWHNKKFIVAIIEERPFENYTKEHKWFYRQMFNPMHGILFYGENWGDIAKGSGHNYGRWKLDAPRLNFTGINNFFPGLVTRLNQEYARLSGQQYLWDRLDESK